MGCDLKSEEKDAVLKAGLPTPMGSNNLCLYADKTFELTHKKLLSKTVYKGTWTKKGDTLTLSYTGEGPYFGNRAMVDDSFLVFSKDGINELLEIKVNRLEE